MLFPYILVDHLVFFIPKCKAKSKQKMYIFSIKAITYIA